MAGRIITLLILILVLAGGGILWFDYLNLIDAKTVLAPLYRLIGREGRTGGELGPDEYIDLNDERFAIRMEAQTLRELDMDRRDEEMAVKLSELEQIAEQLEEDRKNLEEMQISINSELENAENMARNVEGISVRLTNMQPERAVAIIVAMNDQNAIDVIRKTEEIAQRDGTRSLVPYWFQLMASTDEGAARAAELQRKMVAGSP